MSSSRSPALEFELRRDARVPALVAGVGFAGMVLIAGYASTVAIAAPWLALTLLIVAWAVRAPPGRRVRTHPPRLRIEGDVWMVVLSDGQRRPIALRRPTGRLGRWWFIHWAGGWAVITQRSIGVRAWRSLTARLKDTGRRAAPRGASRAG
ncbi:MAG: hypothetical protein ACRETU_01375 [Steroidobacterales bacterium]